mgnify:CR=1 FL=1
MKVRVIKKPEYTALYHVQIKRWWWPFWTTVTYNGHAECLQIADNILKNGHAYTVLMEGEA